MNNDGSVARVAKVWREITGGPKNSPHQAYETTYGEALQQLATLPRTGSMVDLGLQGS